MRDSRIGGTAIPLPTNAGGAATTAPGAFVNDIHSRLNATRVARIVPVASLEAIRTAVLAARAAGLPVCIAGGRHAMGGQQFAAGGVLLDTRPMRRVLGFDRARGLVQVEAGIQWPELLQWLNAAQITEREPWTFRQKQTGADRLSIGGAVAANIHGRGLSMRPFVEDIESLLLVDADGAVRRCSRDENAEWFRLVVGGYGLFGVVYSVTLRLVRRRLVRRRVELVRSDGLMDALARRVAEGHVYGDYQFATCADSEEFLREGILSTYVPVPKETPIPQGQRHLTPRDWAALLELAHVDKRRAYERYATHYLATDGQVYTSDGHQMSTYLDDYHLDLDRRHGAGRVASEMITEIYVPRACLLDFLEEVRVDFRAQRVRLIYGTIRLIERDEETALAWARESWACTIFNLCVEHSPTGLARAAAAFRRLIDMAVARAGSYYLTYHRWATPAQVDACHPRMREFLALKRAHDPELRFQSEWYRYHASMLGDA